MLQTTPRTPANILAGPARIYLGIYGTAVLPVTGTPPTLFAHTAGVPSGLQTGFTEVGYTTGKAEWSYKLTKGELVPEQSLAPVDVFAKEEGVQLQFTCMEAVYRALQAAFDAIGTSNDSTGSLFYGGNGTSVLAPSYWGVFLSSIHRDNTAKFSWLNIYKSYSVDGIKLPFEKQKETTYSVTLKAVADVTRNAGDQLFQSKIEQ